MAKTIKILYIGDIVGKPGRRAAKEMIPAFRASEKIDYVFANGENLAAGKGMTLKKYDEMMEAGVDYFTSGNHIFNNDDIRDHLDDENVKVLRPANYHSDKPGRGVAEIGDGIVLISLQGRVFMTDEVKDPFVTLKDLARKYKDKIIVVDFHAEATSEKVALGFYLDGEVSAFLGTHTHIQTADEKILPNGTGYITDIGMTGPSNSVLGVEKEIIIEKFLTAEPLSHKVASGDTNFCAVIITVDRESKKTISIERINKYLPIS